jgi:hypothetical protein
MSERGGRDEEVVAGLFVSLDGLFPIVVGTGKRLFDDWSGRAPMKLVDSRTFTTGVVSLVYGPADEGAA